MPDGSHSTFACGKGTMSEQWDQPGGISSNAPKLTIAASRPRCSCWVSGLGALAWRAADTRTYPTNSNPTTKTNAAALWIGCDVYGGRVSVLSAANSTPWSTRTVHATRLFHVISTTLTMSIGTMTTVSAP